MSLDNTMNSVVQKIIQPESCGNCRFWMASARVCRRLPPIPIMIGLKQGLAGQEPAINAYFPVMGNNGWCGEYKPSATVEE